jgi:ABC-2 type transport system permease protein
MINHLRRKVNLYSAFAAMVPKLNMAYSNWVWMSIFTQALSMTIYVFFWRAVYSATSLVGGLTLPQTLNYILLAQIFLPVISNRLILGFGSMVREGEIAIELLRPIDFETRQYVQQVADLVFSLLLKLPLVLLAWLAFGLKLPSSPAVWGAFLVSLLLGHAVVFFFDWIFACLAFYSTETWGLSVVREGVAVFFSGALVPLVMMPGWLQHIAAILPFSQAVAVPVSILSGVTSLSQVWGLFLVQLAWLIGLAIASKTIFGVAVRKVTVQGG